MDRARMQLALIASAIATSATSAKVAEMLAFRPGCTGAHYTLALPRKVRGKLALRPKSRSKKPWLSVLCLFRALRTSA